jgi:murein DD-endopeptidase MepM/ murein hydrolase activator NlpD
MTAALLLTLALTAAAAPTPPKTKPEGKAREYKPGEIALLTATHQRAGTPPEGTAGGKTLEWWPGASTGTWHSFLSFDLDAATGPVSIRARLSDARGKTFRRERELLVEAAAFPVVELTVERKFVTPDKTDAERAESESARLIKLFVTGEPKRLFEGSFVSPIPGAATARFGERRIFNGQPRSPHSGMDLKARAGVPVKAPAAGKVVLADSLFYQGKTVVLDHGLGLTTLYAHLSKIAVKPGDAVKKGQVIGKVGATGRVTGPHLHWALKHRGARVDPYSLAHLDLDATVKAKPEDPLKRSPLCGDPGLPPAPKWGKAHKGLRLRARPSSAESDQGARPSALVEILNAGKKSAFLDFPVDPAQRGVVLAVGADPVEPKTRPLTTQLKLAPGRILCFEQDRGPYGELLPAATHYPAVYDTSRLYGSTATARAGIWTGRLLFP